MGFIRDAIEYAISRYSLASENRERFANLLNRILPPYVAWTWGQDSIYKRHFSEWQKHGFNLTPNHYYSPIPEATRLTDEVFRSESAMPGIDMREAKQLAFLEQVCAPFRNEYTRFRDSKTSCPYEFHFNNSAFERIDAEVLHSIIRHHKPRHLIEVGSGYSTLVSAAACVKNEAEGVCCEFIAIEPFPNQLFQTPIPGLSRLICKPLEAVDVCLFSGLQAGDILFIDSSHVLRIGGDVQRLYLEILPRLNPGVLVHIHDIFLPGEYPEKWVRGEHVFWNEQYLLQAFLCWNQSFFITWAGYFMHRKYPDKLTEYFPGYDPERCLPGSFWIERRS